MLGAPTALERLGSSHSQLPQTAEVAEETQRRSAVVTVTTAQPQWRDRDGVSDSALLSLVELSSWSNCNVRVP